MVITDSLTDKQLLDKIYMAADAYEKLLGKKYLLVGHNKREPYYWFECVFEKKNFMHLLGIKSVKYGAERFFDMCAEHNNCGGEGVNISDCRTAYNHSRKNVNMKCSCCADMLDIKASKYMKIGNKDLINQYVDFDYAYGNEATLGFCVSESSFPVTLLPKPIDNYSTDKHRVILVFEKKIGERIYGEPVVEAKEGLFEEVYSEFPDELRKMVIKP
jgi:hypothetical protein